MTHSKIEVTRRQLIKMTVTDTTWPESNDKSALETEEEAQLVEEPIKGPTGMRRAPTYLKITLPKEHSRRNKKREKHCSCDFVILFCLFVQIITLVVSYACNVEGVKDICRKKHVSKETRNWQIFLLRSQSLLLSLFLIEFPFCFVSFCWS